MKLEFFVTAASTVVIVGMTGHYALQYQKNALQMQASAMNGAPFAPEIQPPTALQAAPAARASASAPAPTPPSAARVTANSPSAPAATATAPAKSGATQAAPSGGTASVVLSAVEVAKHASPQDCWIIIQSNVYNVTSYLRLHPGGAGRITPYCGRDATQAFATKGGEGTHSRAASADLARYLLGPLNSASTVQAQASAGAPAGTAAVSGAGSGANGGSASSVNGEGEYEADDD
jgi:cytochrome b involved in lipid metabolism